MLSCAVALTLAACGQRAPSAVPSESSEHHVDADVAVDAPIKVVPEPVPAADPAPVLAESAPTPRLQLSECLAANDTKVQRAATLHRWVDAKGITHYSDQAPSETVRDHRELSVSGAPPVTVEASGYDVGVPDTAQQRAVTDALAIRRVFHDALGVTGEGVTQLRIVFVRDPDAFSTLVGDPMSASSAGAYSPAKRTIYVRTQPNDEMNFAVLRHEITHALVHELVGNLPTPINEGLASYFQRYAVAGLGGQVDMSPDRHAFAAAVPDNPDEALVELLASDPVAFYGEQRQSSYARGQALVALLMQSAPGRTALGKVLAEQRTDPCVPARAELILDAGYPGGLRALAVDWAAFLREIPNRVQTY